MISTTGDHLGLASLNATLALFGRGGGDRAFAADARTVAADLARMRASPVALQRPVVILSGYHTPAQVAWWLRVQLSRHTSRTPRDFVAISYPAATAIDQATELSLSVLQRRLPGSHSEAAVDTVGISMGGIVARYAALPPEHRTHPARPTSPTPARLSIARLFTFATPHLGSIRAARIAPDEAARDMKPGSPFLAALNTHKGDYPVVCYVQRGDGFVIPEAAAPPGHTAFTADGSRLMSHFTTAHNPWFLADLARRLRGEPPLLGEHAR